MPRLVYRKAALRDLANIAEYIERADSRAAADAFIEKLNVIHGARDMDAYFAAQPDDDDT